MHVEYVIRCCFATKFDVIVLIMEDDDVNISGETTEMWRNGWLALLKGDDDDATVAQDNEAEESEKSFSVCKRFDRLRRNIAAVKIQNDFRAEVRLRETVRENETRRRLRQPIHSIGLWSKFDLSYISGATSSGHIFSQQQIEQERWKRLEGKKKKKCRKREKEGKESRSKESLARIREKGKENRREQKEEKKMEEKVSHIIRPLRQPIEQEKVTLYLIFRLKAEEPKVNFKDKYSENSLVVPLSLGCNKFLNAVYVDFFDVMKPHGL
ncbi:hypothetical protein Tco_1018605 [Tanacetum coccineum]|uniref:Uncharacterized protein n=1 Tax=Tanacetum coccineum TaxID=301880 RepID=A0ABQ5FWC1_9ASTR